MFAAGFVATLALPVSAPSVPLTASALDPLPLPPAALTIPRAEASVPKPQEPGVPVRLSIPAIGVDAKIVDLGLLPDGKLDAPAKGEDTGWYRLGPRPGARGQAVIDGHLTLNRAHGVFWSLDELRPGDLLSVTDDAGAVRTFRVREAHVYHVHDAPMQEIFGDKYGRHLNLITCAGVWRPEMNHYDKRLVVYTDLVEEEPDPRP